MSSENLPSQEPVRILHLEDNDYDAVLFSEMVGRALNCEIRRAKNREEFVTAIPEFKPHLILSDHTIPGFSGLEALSLVSESYPDIPFIFVSGTLGEEAAVESLRCGAVDYILKEHPERLVAAVSRALRDSRERAERRRMQETLRVLAAAVNQQASDAIVITTADLDFPGPHIIYVNPAFTRMTGYTAEETIGKSPRILQGPKTDRALLKSMRAKLEAGECFNGETINYRKDGSSFFIEWHVSPVRNAAGEVTHYVEVQRDVTERKQTERRIREQALLLDKAQDAIFVRDLDQRISFWSKGAERIYGWTAEEVHGHSACDLLHTADSPQPAELWQTVLRSGEWIGELQQVTKEGRRITVESRVNLVRDEDGTAASALAINTDVTSRKEMEAQFLRTQRIETIGVLAGGIAHDLNNLLAPIMMGVDMLRASVMDEAASEMFDLMKVSAQRGSELVRQILSFSRGMDGERVAVDIGHLVKDAIAFARDTFPRSIEIKMRVPRELPPVSGNATQIHQVLLNLCVNARDAMPGGGQLSVEVRRVAAGSSELPASLQGRPEEFILITVGDTGTGIPPEIVDRIFEPFFTTKREGKGTGLGLSTVRSIVRAHRGAIDVESKVGAGTRFRVLLPFSPGSPELEIEHPGEAGPPMGRGERILFVDDENAIREMVRLTLTLFNYRVTTAEDGSDGLAVFERCGRDFDLVITDLMMPKMDGPQLIRVLEQLAPRTKVICTSGVGSVAKLAELEDLKVAAKIRKPYTVDQLLFTIREILDAKVL